MSIQIAVRFATKKTQLSPVQKLLIGSEETFSETELKYMRDVRQLILAVKENSDVVGCAKFASHFDVKEHKHADLRILGITCDEFLCVMVDAAEKLSADCCVLTVELEGDVEGLMEGMSFEPVSSACCPYDRVQKWRKQLKQPDNGIKLKQIDLAGANLIYSVEDPELHGRSEEKEIERTPCSHLNLSDEDSDSFMVPSTPSFNMNPRTPVSLYAGHSDFTDISTCVSAISTPAAAESKKKGKNISRSSKVLLMRTNTSLTSHPSFAGDEDVMLGAETCEAKAISFGATAHALSLLHSKEDDDCASDGSSTGSRSRSNSVQSTATLDYWTGERY